MFETGPLGTRCCACQAVVSAESPVSASCFMYECCSCAHLYTDSGDSQVLGCLTWVTEGAIQNELCLLFKPEGLGQGSLARFQQAVVLPLGSRGGGRCCFRVQLGSHSLGRFWCCDLVLHGGCINYACVCMYSHVYMQVCVRVHGEGLGQRTTLGVIS